MKVTFLFNELTVPSVRVRASKPSFVSTSCRPRVSLPLSFLLSIAAREKEYNVAGRPENYKFSYCGASPAESSLPSRSTKWVTMVFNTSSCGIIHARDRSQALRGIRVADIDTDWRKYRLAANSLGLMVKDLHELYYAILLLQPWMWVFRTSSVELRTEWIFISQRERVIWTMDEQSRSHSVVTTWIGSRDMISKPKLIVLESTTL